MTEQIICRDASLGYENMTVASGIDFTVKEGDYLCILGENGSGKSTLIKTILGLKSVESGSIEWCGGLTPDKIGYLPQQTVVQRDFPASVMEIVLSGCLTMGGLRPFYSSGQKQLAQENIERLGIENLSKRCYRELSGGQQQRVLLARALCAASKALLLDEPVTGLDPKAQTDLYELIKDLNKYYDMIIYNTNSKEVIKNNFGLGIDVGVKSYASIYNGKDSKQVKHFKDYERYKCLSKRIIKLQQVLSKKAEINYYRLLNAYIDKHEGNEPNEQTKNIMKGESYNSSNIRRIKSKIRRLFNKLRNIRKDYINKLVNMIVARTKPLFITIEDLSISISNIISGEGHHTLHKYITESGFYYFKERLIRKCQEYNIELRIADKYFASSKKCCICGHKNKNLTLSDRTFICPKCGNERDRDLNAAINLYNTKKYSIYA